MKNWFKDEEVRKKIFTFAISGCIIVLFYCLIRNVDGFGTFIKRAISALSPFIWGLLFALFTYKLANKIEKALPEKWKFKLKRSLSTTACIIVILLVITIVVMIIVPQLIKSISELSVTINYYADHANEWVKNISDFLKLSNKAKESIYSFSSSTITRVWEFIVESFPSIVDATKNTITGIGKFVMGLVICVYILFERETLRNQLRRVCRAILPEKFYDHSSHVFRLGLEKFSQYLSGKIIDSILVGVVCFIIMVIFRMEYSALISVIVGMSNIVPFFGPLIGGIIGIFIILIANPSHAIPLAIIVLVLQQIDGNIIEPLIIGDSVGLSSIWVMFAIIIGGEFFGFAGMVLGIPVFSVIYFLIKEWVNERNAEKQLEMKEKG